MAFRLAGRGLPDEQAVELWVGDDGLISSEPVPGAQTLTETAWVLPGLVDAHCHVGIRSAVVTRMRPG